MKHTLLKIAGAALLLASCSEIDLDDRYTFESDPSKFEPQRTVLVEEYTGQTCVNCPSGHTLLKLLENKFNSIDQVGIISVGLHVQQFGLPVAQGGFYVPEVDSYAQGFEIAPSARIDGGEILKQDQWTNAILKEITKKAEVQIPELRAELKDGSITVGGNVFADNTFKGAKLQLWLVEDEITSWQYQSGGGIDMAYEHHAVFRGALNGINGSDIELKEGRFASFGPVVYPMPDYCNGEHLRVVAIIRSAKNEVLNCAQAPVVPQ